METSVKAPEVLLPPQPDSSSLDAAPPAACASSDFLDPMKEFSRRLEDIGRTSQVLVEAELQKMETNNDITVAMETEASLVVQSLKKFSSPQEKLDDLVQKYVELVALRRCDEKKVRSLLAERQQLETLCRDLQDHYGELREETLQRCRDDEDKRTEMVNHFQTTLTEIQTQIEQHSARNDKLCHENSNLTDKLESLMSQCEQREESLEKINKRRDLQQKLMEAKLQQANVQLSEAEEKHSREKEYLLREAIDKTKKCFAMKEQELALKKKLTLYAQKFDEFQATLAKSNEIYARFKKEMDNMSDKMKTMEKESNLWKTRFENCNKALTDMIEERSEKNKEFQIFVLKIQKLEMLCRALQEERVVLYSKIKEVRHANSSLQVSGRTDPKETPVSEAAADLLELQEIQEADPVLTEDMTRLREEQAKLQEFAASLLATPSSDEREDQEQEPDLKEDAVASAFVHFQTKSQVQKEAEAKPEAAESVPRPAATLPEPVKEPVKEEIQEPAPTSEPEKVQAEPTSEPEKVQAKPTSEPEKVQAEPTSEPEKVQAEPTSEPEKVQAEPTSEPEKVQAEPTSEPEKVQAEPTSEPEKVQAEPTSEPEKVQIHQPTDLKPEAAEAVEVKPVVPEEEKKVRAEPSSTSEPEKVQAEPVETPARSETSSNTTAASDPDSWKKQTPKKKKKRNAKSAS